MARRRHNENDAERRDERENNTPRDIYSMMREKARSMGHAAAKLPDDVWKKVIDMRDERSTLRDAKLYVENYMMGNLKPDEFARVMAEDDNLRYTISDLCRMRLEPTELNIHRNNNFVDVVAGAKTFWTEIRVPLPSEVEAARDLRNIYFGVEAGKAATGKPAEKGVDTQPGDISESTEERAGKRRSLREILDEARRTMAEKAIEKLTPPTEGKKPEERESEAGLDEGWLDTDEGQDYKAECTKKAAQHIEDMAMNIEASKSKDLTPDERRRARESVGLEGDAPDVPEELFTDQDVQAANGNEASEESEYRSGYSESDLNRPMDDEMKALFDQIMRHVNAEAKDEPALYEDWHLDDDDVPARSKGRIQGQYEGKDVSFKDTWAGHKFTDEEAQKLLNGETISFTYTGKNNKERTASGSLEWQTFDGNEFIGFKPNHHKKSADVSNEAVAEQASEAPAAGQAAPPDEVMFSEADESMMEYYAQMGDGGYQEDESAYMDFSAEDLDAMFNDGGMQMERG